MGHDEEGPSIRGPGPGQGAAGLRAFARARARAWAPGAEDPPVRRGALGGGARLPPGPGGGCEEVEAAVVQRAES